MSGNLQCAQGKVLTSQPLVGQLATPWLLHGNRLHASQSAVSRTQAIQVEPNRTNPPMAMLTAIDPVGSNRTQ
jgi:hypothetical protein